MSVRTREKTKAQLVDEFKAYLREKSFFTEEEIEAITAPEGWEGAAPDVLISGGEDVSIAVERILRSATRFALERHRDEYGDIVDEVETAVEGSYEDESFIYLVHTETKTGDRIWWGKSWHIELDEFLRTLDKAVEGFLQTVKERKRAVR